MILGIGIDRVLVSRIERLMARFPLRFINRILSHEEQSIAGDRLYQASYIAKRFAAKEAISKALGTGIGTYLFTDLMVLKDKNEKPIIGLSPKAKAQMKTQFPQAYEFYWHISLVDEDDTAMAFVILEAR